MSYLCEVLTIGGRGGNDFDFTSTSGATMQKLWVWAAGWQIKAIKVWLTDGRCQQFGEPGGSFSEFVFQDGEHFSSLSLWGNGAGTRLGGIKLRTTRSREFFVHMTDWGLKTEYPIDVGSGICVGVQGSAGADIDCLGFVFINTIKNTVMKDVQYPTLHDVIPQVKLEELKSSSYENNTSETQEYTIETTTKLTRKSSWSVKNKIESTFSVEVSAGIPEVADVSAGVSFTVGSESTYVLENTEEKTEKLSFPVKVPPGKTVTVKITIGRVNVDLPYTATVQVTCFNDKIMEFPTSGTYKGVTYTQAKVVVSD